MIKLIADEPFEIKTGDRFAQGIFMEYGIAVNDDATAKRNGGFGSSGE
jgi:dUTP pyrophosphatase